jgi:hypothetical protein
MIVWGMRYVPDKLTTIRQSVPLLAVFNSRVWPGLTTYLDGEKKSFILDREGRQFHFPVIDPHRWIGPFQTMKDAYDLIVFLTNRDANDPSLIEDFLAISERPIPASPKEHLQEKIVNPGRFQIARRALRISTILKARDWEGLKVEPFEGGITFYLTRNNRTESYVTLDDVVFKTNGIQQRLDGFDLYVILTDRVGVNPAKLQHEFTEFVLEHCSPEVAGQLAS